jgi:hypothetical protein
LKKAVFEHELEHDGNGGNVAIAVIDFPERAKPAIRGIAAVVRQNYGGFGACAWMSSVRVRPS